MNPNIDPDSDTARLEAHRKLHNIGLPPHPHAQAAFNLDLLDTDLALRTRLVELGWRPPARPVDQPQCPTVAWMHPTAELATTDPDAYTGLSAGKPRELIFKSHLIDHVDWLEHGIHEWRTYAIEIGRQLKVARDQLAAVKTDSKAVSQTP